MGLSKAEVGNLLLVLPMMYWWIGGGECGWWTWSDGVFEFLFIYSYFGYLIY